MGYIHLHIFTSVPSCDQLHACVRQPPEPEMQGEAVRGESRTHWVRMLVRPTWACPPTRVCKVTVHF